MTSASLQGSFLFSTMITLYSQLLICYQANPEIKPLDHLQKTELGKKIAKTWYSQDNRNQFKDHLVRVTSEEDTGTFRVLAYPDYFVADIDKLIGDFYTLLTKKDKRPRRNIRKPIDSSRNYK